MPYIQEKYREHLDKLGQQGISPDVQNAGELNYLFTNLINIYIKRRGMNYNSINDIVGALECSKLELYRRVAAPYEDKKIKENGDVYNV
jgi:hypothetical protein